MDTPLRSIPIREMAAAMLSTDRAFAQRVRAFEARFGPADSDTLAVLAQAAYFCWGNSEYRQGLLNTCRAVDEGRPTAFHLHAQITPQRWAEVHAYVVGVQRWLGADLPVPELVDVARLEQIAQWLGERTPVREALAELFLSRLIGTLAGSKVESMGDGQPLDAPGAPDFAAWYARRDGSSYLTGRMDFERACRERIREAMPEAPAVADGLARGIGNESPPPCVHRFTRYLDIQLASIGAQKWRGNLPPDTVPRAAWQGFVDEARAGLQAWVDGLPPATPLGESLHEALGTATDAGRAIVADFLLAEDRGSEAPWDWLAFYPRGA